MAAAKFKSWVEGNKWDVENIENEIRKFCHSNDIEIVELHSEKSGWFQKTCYFDLRGDESKLNIIRKTLLELPHE